MSSWYPKKIYSNELPNLEHSYYSCPWVDNYPKRKGNKMGVYQNIEIGLQVEEADRIIVEPGPDVLTRRKRRDSKRRSSRRETYRAPKHWVVTNVDMVMIFALVPMSMALGFLLGVLIVGGHIV